MVDTRNSGPGAFEVKDCALIAIATGRRAQNLKELRDELAAAHPGCIYYHFWGGLLHSRFEEREYSNDFAGWVRHGLHDVVLGERLGVIDPSEFRDLEDLRRELVEVIEQRLDEREYPPWSDVQQQFHFIRSQVVVFDTRRRISEPGELAAAMPHLSVGSVFYHFIDARRRTRDGADDFTLWLDGFGPQVAPLRDALAAVEVDPYLVPLTDLRRRLAELMARVREETP